MWLLCGLLALLDHTLLFLQAFLQGARQHRELVRLNDRLVHVGGFGHNYVFSVNTLSENAV